MTDKNTEISENPNDEHKVEETDTAEAAAVDGRPLPP